MDNLLEIYRICFWCCLGVAVLGTGLAVLSFWRYNIGQIWAIRTGAARKKAVREMHEHSQKTGNLKPQIDMDFTTGNLKSGKIKGLFSGKTGEASEGLAVEKKVHTGETGIFKTSEQTEMPEAQKAAVLEADRQAETRETGVLAPVGETSRLDIIDYIRENSAIEPESEDPPGDVLTNAYAEVSEDVKRAAAVMPFVITVRETEIHTNEAIEM